MRTFLLWSFVLVFGFVVFDVIFNPPTEEERAQEAAVRAQAQAERAAQREVERIEREALRAAEREEAERIRAEEEAACREDLQCWAAKFEFRAGGACEREIESLARYAHQWTDGWLDVKFDRIAWIDEAAGHVSYFGDKIQFQNAFGAWQNMNYRCDYDTVNERVVDVVISGR